MTTINHKTLSNSNTHMFCPDGLLSARPASPTNAYNPYYYATDTNQLFVYFGSAWVETSLNSYIGTCSTASATAEKTVAITGFALTTGIRVKVTFTNANTATTPTLNISGTGAKAIYNEGGVAVSATSPAYFPAGATIEFYYDGTNFIYINRVIDSYVNGTSWYNLCANGWIEQGGQSPSIGQQTITFLKAHSNTNYYASAICYNSVATVGDYTQEEIKTKNTTSIVINAYIGTTNAAATFIWQTKGY